MTDTSIGKYAAQIAAGSGDARREFYGDAGSLRDRDVATIAPRDEQMTQIQGSAAGKLRTQVRRNRMADTIPDVKADRMVELRSNVRDTIALLEAQTDDGQHRMRALHRRQNETNAQTMHELTMFDEEFVYTNLVGFTVPRVIKEAGMDMQVEFFEQFGMPITYPEEADIELELKSLNERLLTVEEAEQHRRFIRGNITRPLFPFGDKGMPDTLVNVNVFAKTDVLNKTEMQLNAINEVLKVYDRDLQELQDEYHNAQSAEKFDRAEELHGKLMDLKAKKVRKFAEKVRILAGGAKDDEQQEKERSSGNSGLLARLETVLRSPAIGELLTEKAALKAQAQEDIRRMEIDRLEKLKQHEGAISKYNHHVMKSKQALQKNYEDQHEMWVQIEGLLDAIEARQGEAKQHVAEHMKTTEIEQKRRQEHREYLHSYGQHRHTLDELVVSCDLSSLFLNATREFIEDNKRKIEAMQVEEKIRDKLFGEKRAYDQAYASYGDDATKAITRYEQRMTGIDTLLEGIQFNKRQASAVGDDKAQEVAKRGHALEISNRDLKRRRDYRQAQLDEIEEEFLDIDNHVDDDGADADESPAVQIRSIRAARRMETIQKFDELHQEMAAALDEEKAAMDNVDAEVNTLQNVVAMKRQTGQLKSPGKPLPAPPPPETSPGVTPRFGSPPKQVY